MSRMHTKLLLWDLDGVIVDSEPVHEQVRAQLTLELSGGRTVELGYDPTGTNTLELYRNLMRSAGVTGDAEYWTRRQYRGVVEQIRRTGQPMIPGVAQTLAHCRREGIDCAVVSSSRRDYVEEILELYGVLQQMRAVVCDDGDLPLKPAPDLYKRALRLCGAAAEEAIAVEDSAVGLAAARSAGIRCIAYRAEDAFTCQDACGAALVVKRLGQIPGCIVR